MRSPTRHWGISRGFFNPLAALLGGLAALAGAAFGSAAPASQVTYHAPQEAAVAAAAPSTRPLTATAAVPPGSGTPPATAKHSIAAVGERPVTQLPPSGYVTALDLTQALAALRGSLAALVAAQSDAMVSGTNGLNQGINGGNLTVNGSLHVNGVQGLSANDLPNLSGSYLSTGGGSLTGLGIFGAGFISQASSTVTGNLTVSGTSTLPTIAGGLGIGGPHNVNDQLSFTDDANGDGIGFYNSSGNLQSNIFLSSGTANRGLTVNLPGATGQNGHGDNWFDIRNNTAGLKMSFGVEDFTGLPHSWIQGTGDLWFAANSAVNSSTTPQLVLTGALDPAGPGKLGIGTTTPYGVLSVTNTVATLAGSPLFTVASTTLGTATTTLFQINNNGNVGIGTTTPQAALDIASSGNGLLNLTSSASFAEQQISSYRNSATTHGVILFQGARGTASAPSVLNAGDALMSIRGTGWTSSGFADSFANDSVQLEGYADESFTPTAIGGRFAIRIANDGTTNNNFRLVMDGSGNACIGTSCGSATSALEPNTTLEVFDGSATAPGITRLMVREGGSQGSNEVFGVYSGNKTSARLVVQNGNVGIGTTTPWRTLSVNGTVGFAGLTNDTADSKTLCLTANNEVVSNSGSSCITSSERFKNTIQPLDAASGLAEVMQLNPVSFLYNADIGIPGTQIGFIAEQMQQIDPRLVVLDASGTPFTVRYENLTAVLAKAIQDIASIEGAFKGNLIAWLGNASNGINDFFAHTTHQQALCVGSPGNETCITKPELDALLNSVHIAPTTDQSGQGSASAAQTTDATTTPAAPDTNTNATATPTDSAPQQTSETSGQGSAPATSTSSS